MADRTPDGPTTGPWRYEMRGIASAGVIVEIVQANHETDWLRQRHGVLVRVVSVPLSGRGSRTAVGSTLTTTMASLKPIRGKRSASSSVPGERNRE